VDDPLSPLHADQAPTVLAPDGSTVRVLLTVPGGGSMARFELRPGQVAAAVRHRTVSELWYVLDGRGQMWREHGGRNSIVDLQPGLCLSVPVGAAFQFRAAAGQGLSVIATTMPPWPGEGEAMPVVGPWQADGP
jgi:mannose-6-phosphate isomerase-like protein (cupin superfamily)